MKKWIVEDWEFEITVLHGEAEQCRMGLETGDQFHCTYECPAGFCPKRCRYCIPYVKLPAVAAIINCMEAPQAMKLIFPVPTIA